ncbi:hypothetical protein GWK48_01405 [Metallosphaera tengchongensis]|uniref:Uncharacterized protein n=1 Tax=Metallosphaera tengchongensis TaxID=1532350 RepID=A0A6N0NVQ0_9CREN|nr:hypothetical protein [Metallosphaera tengchongensis]QKQ99229.1 hypothetical protein GWK48_01405 [Metallosphaera tengchongensis]
MSIDQQFFDYFITITLLSISHGLEPDHISAARMVKGKRKLVQLALFHSVGFLVISIPLSIVLTYYALLIPFAQFLANLIGIIFGSILVMSAVTGKEIEIEPKSGGLVQGMFNVTPSKLITIVLAIKTGSVVLGSSLILWFGFVTSISIISIGMINAYIPVRFNRTINLVVGVVTIVYFLSSMIR